MSELINLTNIKVYCPRKILMSEFSPMEKGRIYRLNSDLQRRTFDRQVNSVDRNFALGPTITVKAGTEVEVMGVDGDNTAAMIILSGENKGVSFPVSIRTQAAFSLIEED